MEGNSTSSSLTVTWKEGRSGNMPPVIYRIKVGENGYASCEENTGFDFEFNHKGTEEGIKGSNHLMVLEQLHYETSYCVRIHGENQRAEGPNSTQEYECQCGFATTGVAAYQIWKRVTY